MCQRKYWLEMHSELDQKYQKRFKQMFKNVKSYNEDDCSDEAFRYKAGLKFYKRAALKKIEEEMSNMDLD